MRLATERVDGWPPLAWLARCFRGTQAVQVLHGAGIEVGEGFACEAVWPGEFQQGDLDRASVVAGSGMRTRSGEAIFVSSTSTVDRLHSVDLPDGPLISNSLACLMSAIGASARLDYFGYRRDIDSIRLGLERYRREIPTTAEPVRLTYFTNLAWDGTRLVEREKPPHPSFRTFKEYRDVLRSTIAGIAESMTNPARNRRYRWLGTLSSGYDSATATTLGAEVGCDEAICFDRSRRGEPDSGEPIARALGIEPRVIERAGWRRRAARFDRMPEVPFLAATPTGELAPFAAAREFLGGRVLLTGFQGGAAWRLRTDSPGPEIARKDSSGLGFAEFRLVSGFINCPPAFWAAREAAQLAAIGRSEEMRPWVIGERYQRPVARRIVEEAGVPREAFGQEPQPGVGGALIKDPEFLGAESLADYRAWLRRNAGSIGTPQLLATAAVDVLARGAAPPAKTMGAAARAADGIARRPATRVIRRRVERLENRIRPLERGVAVRMFAFPWALERAGERYSGPGRR